MKKIKSVAHALEVLGQKIDLNKLAEGMLASGVPEGDVKPLVAHFQITKIIEAHNNLNGKWKADWANSNQYKYSVWQWIKKDESKPSGFGFSRTGYGDWTTHTAVGSRLCVGSSEAAIYIGTDFGDLFETAWLIIEPKKAKK